MILFRLCLICHNPNFITVNVLFSLNFVSENKMQYLDMLGAAKEELGGGSAEISIRRTQ